MGDEITSVALQFLNKGTFDKCINFTCIVLLPKVKNPVNAFDFRPISLYNVIYKILSKVLANILKLILPDIIFKNQSAFVPSRLIYDNIIVAYEALHFMKTRQRSHWQYGY